MNGRHARIRAALLSTAVGGLLTLNVGATNAVAAEEPASEAMQEAARLLERFEFDDAAKQFEVLRAESDHSSQQQARAAFGLAMALEAQRPSNPQSIERARTLYREAAEHLPADLAAEALLRLGQSYEIVWTPDMPPNLPEARKHYQTVLTTYPESTASDRAALFLAGTYLQDVADPRSVRAGLDVIDAYVVAAGDRPFASAMWQVKGLTLLRVLGDVEQGVRALVEADRIGLTNPTDAAVLYWQIATGAEQFGDVPLAARYYTKIIENVPRGGRAFESQLALERLKSDHPALGLEIPDLPEAPVRSRQAEREEE